MEFQVLGRVGFRTEETWVRPRGALRRRMLAILLARAGQVVSYDTLAEALWPGQDDDARVQERATARLHLHAHRFRQDLDRPERLVADGSGYLLQVEQEELDAARFMHLSEEVRALPGTDPRRASLAREALAQWPDPWGGDAYPDLDVPLIADEAQRLAQLRLDVAEILCDAEIRLGRHQEVLGDLEKLAQTHPLRESLQVLLMRGLHQAGRPAEALEVYARARRSLIDELGMEPGQALRRMQEFVLSGRSAEATATDADPVAHPRQHAPPAQLPATPPLVGRESDLDQLDRCLAGGPHRHALISGLPGVGKTALAVTWAAQHREDFPDGQLFVDLQGYGVGQGPSLDAALERFIRALGGDPAAAHDTEERVSTYRSLLAGRRVAVLIDNARSEEQVRPFLPGAPGCVSLVTSRDQLTGLIARDNAHHVALRPLERAHAVHLLRALAGDCTHAVPDRDGVAGPDAKDDAGHGLLGQLADRCAGLPVALRVAGLRAREDSLSLPLADHHDRDGEAVLDLLDVGDPVTSARTVFSWSVDALGEEDLRAFLALGVMVGTRIDVGGLAALTDTDDRAARQSIERLARSNLVFLDEGWVRQHDLIAAYARERAAGLARTDTEAMMRRLLGYYVQQVRAVAALTTGAQEQTRFRDVRHANLWLDRAAAPLVAAAVAWVDFAGAEVIQLSRHLGSALTGRGALELAGQMHSTAALAAEQIGDLDAAARAMQVLATVTGELGDDQGSDQQWERARALALDSGSPAALAVVHNNYADTALLRRGQFPRAWGHLMVALRHSRVAGEDGRTQAIRANIAFLLILLERHERAEQALHDLLEEPVNPSARSNILRSLAILKLRSGHPGEAEPLIREAIDLTTQTSEHVLRSEFGPLQAEARFGLGDTAAARELLERALEELTRQGARVEIVLCLIGLARLDREDHPHRALVHLEEALARTRRDGLREMEFRTLIALGELFDSMGQDVRGLAVRDLAAEIRQASGLPPYQTCRFW